MKKLKKLKKLSLKEEVDKEAQEIEKEVESRDDLDDINVSEDMETSLFNKIQEYEYDKRVKKAVHRGRKKRRLFLALAAVLILVCGSVITGRGVSRIGRCFGIELRGMRKLILSMWRIWKQKKHGMLTKCRCLIQ